MNLEQQRLEKIYQAGINRLEEQPEYTWRKKPKKNKTHTISESPAKIYTLGGTTKGR